MSSFSPSPSATFTWQLNDFTLSLFINLQPRDLNFSKLRKIVKEVISKNKDALTKHNPISILMGEVMKVVKGRADGKKIAELIKEEMK